ncbi:hypothetical protein FRC10_010939 [Ceratobasidium sp. 414]|nr:hypothetical protein FRC10_010939 [Ceratobasidium sp. 414]
MTARKTTGAKILRKVVHTVIGGTSASEASSEKAGKAGKTARKAAAKAAAAVNDPKNTGAATKNPETLGDQNLPTKSVAIPKGRTEGSTDEVISEQPATPAAPVTPSE